MFTLVTAVVRVLGAWERHWDASATRVEGIEKETASKSVRESEQSCDLTNTESYFVSREWTPKRRVVYMLGVECGTGVRNAHETKATQLTRLCTCISIAILTYLPQFLM
jgi:hypothetical protein